MREILFRARITGTEQLIYGLPHSVYDLGIDSILAPGHEIEYIDIETVSQFTGLTDKNGFKIFEGDIIIGQGFMEPRVIEWKGTSFMIDDKECGIHNLSAYDNSDLTVIGNIHDNPELLK